MSLKERFFSLLKKSSGFGGRGAYQFSGEINSLITGISLADTRISTDSLYTVWRNHGDVFASVRELKENVGQAGYKWENAKDSDKDPNIASVKAAEQILNFNQSFRSLKNDLIQDVHISGNAYILLQKSFTDKIIGVQTIDPRTLFVVTDKYGTVKKWIQRVKSDTQEFEPGEIVQWKIHKDPNSPVFGLSPLEPIIWEIRSDLAALVSNYAFFQNDAQPAAQYILDEGIDDEQANKVIDMIQRQLKGSENRHKSIAIKGVKEIKQLSVSPKDMEFALLRKMTTEKVCAALGVPKAILNYTEDVNLANGQEQTRKFWEGTITPLQETLQEFINKTLLPAIGITDIKLCFETRSFDSREWDEASTRADLQLGILTINEVREKRGYKPFDAGTEGEFVDKPILYGGLGVKPLQDVGIDFETEIPAATEDQAEKEIALIKRIANRYAYGQNTEKDRR